MPSIDPHPCTACYLFETRGVCPMARDAYGLETPALVQQRVEALRAGLAQDAPTVLSLSELMRSDAQRQRLAAVPSSSPLVLPAAPAEPQSNDSRKEAIYAVPPHTL